MSNEIDELGLVWDKWETFFHFFPTEEIVQNVTCEDPQTKPICTGTFVTVFDHIEASKCRRLWARSKSWWVTL